MIGPDMRSGIMNGFRCYDQIEFSLASGQTIDTIVSAWTRPKFCIIFPYPWDQGIATKLWDGLGTRDHKMSQLMRLWYLSHRRPAMAQASLCMCTVSPQPLLQVMKYGSRQVQPKIRHLAALDGCAYMFEEWVYGRQKVPWSHDMP